MGFHIFIMFYQPVLGSMVIFDTDRAGLDTVTPPTRGRPGAVTTDTYIIYT